MEEDCEIIVCLFVCFLLIKRDCRGPLVKSDDHKSKNIYDVIVTLSSVRAMENPHLSILDRVRQFK